MPPSKNQKWQDEIAALGNRLVPYVTRKEIPYHFNIVADKDNTVNAFALPGGYVYFTEHMWLILTPDERAAVLAHEITHCDMRHGINEASNEQQRYALDAAADRAWRGSRRSTSGWRAIWP